MTCAVVIPATFSGFYYARLCPYLYVSLHLQISYTMALFVHLIIFMGDHSLRFQILLWNLRLVCLLAQMNPLTIWRIYVKCYMWWLKIIFYKGNQCLSDFVFFNPTCLRGTCEGCLFKSKCRHVATNEWEVWKGLSYSSQIAWGPVPLWVFAGLDV